MRYEAQRTILAIWPLAMAALVAAGLPWQAEQSGPSGAAGRQAQTDDAQRRVLACRERHPAAPVAAQRGDAGTRTQSPAWRREHEAAIERCLRAGA